MTHDYLPLIVLSCTCGTGSSSNGVESTLRATRTDEILWSQAGLIFREQFDVTPTDPAAFSGRVAGESEAIARETQAIEDIARGAALALVNSIFEGF